MLLLVAYNPVYKVFNYEYIDYTYTKHSDEFVFKSGFENGYKSGTSQLYPDLKRPRVGGGSELSDGV